MPDNNDNNVIGLVPAKTRDRRFKLIITYQDTSVEQYIGDYFGVSMENADCFMVGRQASLEEIIPIAFLYIPLIRKIDIVETTVDHKEA